MPKDHNPQIWKQFCPLESVTHIHCQLARSLTIHMLNIPSFHGGTIHSKRLLLDCMPMFPKDTGNRHCDIDMKFLRSTGGEIKKGQIKKSYV